MKKINRLQFLQRACLAASALFIQACRPASLIAKKEPMTSQATPGQGPLGEGIFQYLQRTQGRFDLTRYRQLIGAANPFKEGDATLQVAAQDEEHRQLARQLLSRTTIGEIDGQPLFRDELYDLIKGTTVDTAEMAGWTMGELKQFVLEQPEAAVKEIMPGLSSDVIGCVVKLMSNEELIAVGQKIFNPLPGSQIGSKGYMGARIQPNSPTDHPDDIQMQVFCGWSYAVGDLVLGTNPVSSTPESVARIESTLYDIITTFGLEEVLPNCVLAHIDVQAEVEKKQPGTTGIWFQSLAGTVKANQTFDVTIDKMYEHLSHREGRYGLYAETGQGADFTNGHGEGFDMVVHESRKYGFIRALKYSLSKGYAPEKAPWVHVNDVAGFIGPEVFKTKEQLVRCCLEDTVMGKLHGLTIGLDICSTLHMDVTLDDLDWCIEQVMPANPAYLMALPTKNDPMLSYLTTAFNNHVKIREQFGYKVNDAMWAFFQKLQIIDEQGRPTEHFGDPLWVYYQYRLAKKDGRSRAAIYEEGQRIIAEVRGRGVPIAQGYGEHIWDLPPELDQEVRRLYEDAKVSIWTAMTPAFASKIPDVLPIKTQSSDRKDYVYHPESGEQLSASARATLEQLRQRWGRTLPDVQLLISDGLNANALMDEGHVLPFLTLLRQVLSDKGFVVADEHILITHGRVRAGYQCGEILFGDATASQKSKGIIHIIGERPGSGHHNFSVYLSAPSQSTWSQAGKVDHDISRVVSGISDTALVPERAVKEVVNIFEGLYEGKI
ncbi:MAG: ethanolamine ammonia-lyase subunit EutB [Bacteroidota bacterium]